MSKEIFRSILIFAKEVRLATLISWEHRLTDRSTSGQRLVGVFSWSTWVAGATAGCQDLSCGNPASCPTFIDRGKRVCFHNACRAKLRFSRDWSAARPPGSACLTGFSKSRQKTSTKISDTDVTSLVSFSVEKTSGSLFAIRRCRKSKWLRIYFV